MSVVELLDLEFQEMEEQHHSSCDSPTIQQIGVTKSMKLVGKNPGLQTRLRMQSEDQKPLIHMYHQKETAKVVRITSTDNKQLRSLVHDEHGALAKAMGVPGNSLSSWLISLEKASDIPLW
ncbi:hypothetical protein OIU84_016577 [Salix udensis]|uniref:Uncharacterized protein n=1 Tax=Salix udensis TaxID=889485 RepID=A0AAD6JBL3_9ROSI|nr:hypothetical protein OIU84_016577 [Salix udensis]